MERMHLTTAHQKQLLGESNKKASNGHPSLQKNFGICGAFELKFPRPLSQSAVSKIIKKKQKIYLSTCTNARNLSNPAWTRMGKALSL